MIFTQLTAFALRLLAIYCGWEFIQRCYDLFGAVQILRTPPFALSQSAWLQQMALRIYGYGFSPNQLSDAVTAISLWAFLWLLGAVALWILAIPVARMITRGIEENR